MSTNAHRKLKGGAQEGTETLANSKKGWRIQRGARSGALWRWTEGRWGGCYKLWNRRWWGLSWGLSDKMKSSQGTSLVAQWIRISLPTQRTQVRSLVQEDSTGYGATKPVCHYFRAQVLQLLKPMHLDRACAQQEKPPQWAAQALPPWEGPPRCN